MAKPDETEPAADNTQWGTWEELLLASAVNRYGAKSWDSVAVEIRKRCSAPISLTPDNCKVKYLDLKRRYESATDSGDGDDDVPWLDELKKRRVEELRRELERYDLSIVSLQMKVKRLMEERDNGEEKADLGLCGEIEKNDEQEAAMLSMEPEEAVVKQESGGESQSVDESNENFQTGEVKLENETNPVGTADGSPEPQTGSPVRESSCNGSSDSKPVMEAMKVEPVRDVSESAGEGTKENSDVQSSVTKSRTEGNDKLQCVSRKIDESEKVEECVKENDTVLVKSQPLVDILQIIRSHKLGSVFERQLESQEKLRYKNTIRQHINLKMLQSRLEEGFYSDNNDKFFRDLLLFVNNALVFFSKKSPESLAAIDLRQLISKEMAKTKRNNPTDSSSEKELTTPLVNTVPPRQAPEQPDSLLRKQQIVGNMIVCRKRSSIAAKGKEQQKATFADEKQPDKSLEENRITKKRTRDAFPSGAKKNGKNFAGDTNTNKESKVISKQSRGKGGGSSVEHSESKTDKKKKNPIKGDGKKEGATNFLNRMKRSSSSNNGQDDSEDETREDEKKGGNKGEGKKDQVPVPRKSSGGKQMKEIISSPSKRSVGRQTKRAAAPLPMAASKRSREAEDGEAVAPKQPRKRSRK